MNRLDKSLYHNDKNDTETIMTKIMTLTMIMIMIRTIINDNDNNN